MNLGRTLSAYNRRQVKDSVPWMVRVGRRPMGLGGPGEVR